MSGSLSQLYLSDPNLAVALRRQQQAQGLVNQSLDASPTTWAGALARLVQAYTGNRNLGRADDQIKGIADQRDQEFRTFNSDLPQVAGTPPASVPAPVVGAAPGAPGDTSIPLADRLNNPGALRFAGQTGATNQGGFAAFPTRDAGMQAADAQLALYGTRDGINTLAGAISKWAPPNENDTPAYIARVARETGIDPNTPVNFADPAVRQRVLSAMFKVEGGARSIAGGGAPPPPGAPAADAGGTPTAAPPVAPPSGAGPDAPSGPPRASPLADVYLQQAMALQRKAQQAAASNNPRIQAQAPVLMQQAQLYAGLAKEKPNFLRLRPGDTVYNSATGQAAYQAPDNTGPLNVVQSGVDEKGNPRWRYATRSDAVGQTAPTPGPMVSTNVDLRGANAEAQERGASLAKQAAALRDEAAAAAGTIDQVRQLRNIGAETGRLAPAQEIIGGALDALGVKGTDAVRKATTLQQFNGALSGLVLGAQLAQKGVQTEGDANRMREQYAKSTNTMEGNDFLMRATEAQATRKMEQHDFYENWFAQHKTYDGASQGWNKFIREVPLTIRGPNGVAFFNEAQAAARAAGVPDADFVAQWRAKAAPK